MSPLALSSTLLRRIAVPLLLFGTMALAQKPVLPVSDPANLAGEQVSPQSPADTLPINHGAPALAQMLKKLRTRASLMMIVAHPDDEDGGMLTYESRGLGARVAMLTLTRGEGGQNLMTSDFNDALGLIRTQELLAADRYMGVDQFFGSVVDFGFSKTPEETLAQWTHDRVLYDTVRAVRLYRPLVLTSTWIGGVTDGHGHHQVSGQMNQEVFNAAADPKVFPEMGLPAWAPLKVYARVPFARIGREGMFDYATGKSTPPRFYNYVTKQWTTTAPTAHVMIPEGTVSSDPGMEGDTYLQFARRGLSLQKTQIGGNARPGRAAAYDAPYTRYGSRVEAKEKEQSFFDGIDVSLPGIADLAPAAPASLRAGLVAVDAKLAEAQKAFTVAHPERTVHALREAEEAMDKVFSNIGSMALPVEQQYNLLHELRVKGVQLNKALTLAYGLVVTATTADASPLLTSATTAHVKVRVVNHGDAGMELVQFQFAVPGTGLQNGITHMGDALAQNDARFDDMLRLKGAPPATRPYFSRPNLEQPFYDISQPSLRDAPETPSPFLASLYAVPLPPVSGSMFRLKLVPAVSSSEGVAAVTVPPLSVSLSSTMGILSPSQRTLALTARVRTTTQSAQEGTIKLDLPEGWKATPADAHWSVSAANPEASIAFNLAFPAAAPGKTFQVSATAMSGGQAYREGFRPVGYPGLPATNFYTPAAFKAVAVDVQTARGLKIAYLPGTGDDVVAYLPNLGITPTVITPRDLSDLSQFDAVVLGVRAYAAHPELADAKALLDYAKAGGVVIVQYNTARYGGDQAPYAMEVPGDSAHNVVVEAQPVTILAPDAPLLNWPNKITPADFKGWNEELGHGFAASWDAHFEALTETHDPEQDPQKGGLLYARTGRGAYVYVAYALYRQLPEGVPGAYRIFANLLSLPKNPGAGIQGVGR